MPPSLVKQMRKDGGKVHYPVEEEFSDPRTLTTDMSHFWNKVIEKPVSKSGLVHPCLL